MESDKESSLVESPPPHYDRSHQSSEKKMMHSRAPQKKKATLISSVADLFSTVTLPVLNIIITCILIGVLIYVYYTANGKAPEYKLSGMSLPMAVSLITILASLFISGGLAIGISEYKWVRLQQGGPLSLLDLYDASSRGIGAIINVLQAYRLDAVIIFATLFQIGLIAIIPAAQSILVLSSQVVCNPWDMEPDLQMSFNNLTTSVWDFSTANMYNKRSNTVRDVKGVAEGFGLKQALFEATGPLAGPSVSFACNELSLINCTFGSIPSIHTTAECTKGSLKTQVVDVHTNTVRSLNDYYQFNNATASLAYSDGPSLPEMFYAVPMLSRTNFDLNNLTNTNLTYDPTYNDPRNRKLYGDQSFVLATSNDTFMGFPNDNASIVVYECTFRSALNQSLINYNKKLTHITQSTTPIVFDYDFLSNDTIWNNLDLNLNYTARNAYALQLQLMQMLIADGPSQFKYLAATWSGANTPLDGPSPTWAQFFQRILVNVDLAYAFQPTQVYQYITGGTRCYNTPLLYSVKPASFLPLSLSLLIPTLWWILLWISTLYRTNAVSRGASQTALLVAGLSPALRNEFHGLSHAGQKSLLSRSKKVQARFGEDITADGHTGHAGFGQLDELKPLQARRLSYGKA